MFNYDVDVEVKVGHKMENATEIKERLLTHDTSSAMKKARTRSVEMIVPT
jgi:hypothetical protein